MFNMCFWRLYHFLASWNLSNISKSSLTSSSTSLRPQWVFPIFGTVPIVYTARWQSPIASIVACVIVSEMRIQIMKPRILWHSSLLMLHHYLLALFASIQHRDNHCIVLESHRDRFRQHQLGNEELPLTNFRIMSIFMLRVQNSAPIERLTQFQLPRHGFAANVRRNWWDPLQKLIVEIGNDGPQNPSIQPKCLVCDHVKCSLCTTEPKEWYFEVTNIL